MKLCKGGGREKIKKLVIEYARCRRLDDPVSGRMEDGIYAEGSQTYYERAMTPALGDSRLNLFPMTSETRSGRRVISCAVCQLAMGCYQPDI